MLYAFAMYKAISLHSLRVCCHSNETRLPVAKPRNSAQPHGTPTIPPTYIRVRAVVWTNGRGHYTFRVVYDLREM